MSKYTLNINREVSYPLLAVCNTAIQSRLVNMPTTAHMSDPLIYKYDAIWCIASLKVSLLD